MAMSNEPVWGNLSGVLLGQFIQVVLYNYVPFGNILDYVLVDFIVLMNLLF